MAAQKGVAKFIGASGRSYSKQFYCSDAANALVNWDSGAGATSTSAQSIKMPEASALVDVVLAAATTQTMTQITRSGVPTGDTLLNSVHLASIATRPPLAIPFAAGQECAFIQLA